METWAADASWVEIAAVSAVLNVGTVVTSIGLWRWWVSRRGVQRETRAPVRRDVALTTTTTIVNAAIVLPVWWLWDRGTIELADATPARLVVDIVYLVVGLDLSMYVLHRVFHLGVLYRWFHSWHHTGDERMSSLTLFVMHPFEAAGFGAVIAVLLWARPTSIVGIAVFFGINLIVGTIAHVPLRADDALRPADGWLGGSRLHAGHHARPDTNFGVFSQIWDRALRTRV